MGNAQIQHTYQYFPAKSSILNPKNTRKIKSPLRTIVYSSIRVLSIDVNEIIIKKVMGIKHGWTGNKRHFR